MKQLVKTILVAAAALAAFACTKEVRTETPAATPGTIRFTATLDQPTKATLDAYKVCWEEGDVIAVYNGSAWANSTAITEADIEDDGRTASFTVTIGEASSYTLVYPASAVSSAALPEGAAAGSVMLTLPSEQVIPSGGTVDPAALVQIGTSTEPTKVTFKNAVSLVEFKAPESGITSVYLEGFTPDGAAIRMSGDAAVAAEPGAASGTDPVMSVSGSFTAGQNYFAAVWPQAAVGTIRFCFSKGSQKALRTGNSAAGFDLPVSGGRKFEDFGTLKWFDKIRTKADLDLWASLADFYAAGEVVELAADINYGGETWKPVNGNANSGHFAGIFDGAGHNIYNIVISDDEQFPGFFSTLASNDKMLRVRNLTLGREEDKSALVISSASSENAGALAGRIKNTIIQNVTNNIPVTYEGVISSGTAVFGGLVGRSMNNSEISSCTNNGDVVCNSNCKGVYFGGIVGTVYDNTIISNCTNTGRVARDVASPDKGVVVYGGILGRTGNETDGCVITGCSNTGTIEATVNVKAGQLYFGGIVGMDGSVLAESTKMNLQVLNCTNEGDIKGFNQSQASYVAAGGIMGRMSNASLVQDCVNLGPVTKLGNHASEGCYGGIIGMTSDENGLVKDCINGKSGDSTKGAVSDLLQTSAKNERLGGISGFAQRGQYEGCTNYALVSSADGVKQTYVGGLTGNSTVGKFRNCSNYGDVVVEAQAVDGMIRSAGGLIGLQNGSSNDNLTGEGCVVQCRVSCGDAVNAGIVIGRFSNSVTTVWGTSASPIKVKSGCSVNDTNVTASNYGSLLAGSAYGITASGVASGNNTIWAIFE